jgi:hypothetical protein
MANKSRSLTILGTIRVSKSGITSDRIHCESNKTHIHDLRLTFQVSATLDEPLARHLRRWLEVIEEVS